MRLTLLASAYAVGVLGAIQSRMSGELSARTHNPMETAVWVFGTAWVIAAVLALVVPSIRLGLVRVIQGLRTRQMPWWQLIGGVLGGFYIAAQSISVPQVGVAVFTIAVVAGQTGNSLVVDRLGLGPAGKQSVSARRVIAAALAVVAVTVAVFDRLHVGMVGGIGLLIALLAGCGSAVQQAINGRVGVRAKSPLAVTFVNFGTGTVFLGAGLGLAVGLALSPAAPLFIAPWWAYLGGVIAIAYIGVAAWAVPIVGVLRFALLQIAGSLSGALLLDVVAPTAGTRVVWNLILGVLLAFVAVAVSSVRPGAPRGR